MGISALPSRIGICGSVISSPTGVQGGAPAENGFWCTWNLKKNTSDGDKFGIFATNIYPYFYDWKPMQSIFDILHKNFQEDQLNFQISRISRSCRHPADNSGTETHSIALS